MQIYNNLNRKLEEFQPIHPPQVTIYTCGPTVYDHSHIGHARSCLAWDLLYRYLEFKGYEVSWIRNITNIDDKIVARAREQEISPDKVSRKFTFEFWQDMSALNICWPDYEPRATDYLTAMIKFIQELIDQGYAYETNGDVYFRVNKHKNYGQLKGLSLEDLKEGESRIASNDAKEDQLDFALWKAFPEEPETSFTSPWGTGRPGWHLECSTMIKAILEEKNLGPTLDIHAGGDDLIFPHHENECAQSETLHDKPLAKYWMHNGMVMINGQKMSKSTGNFLTVKDLLNQYKANTIRFFAFSTHYKKQINFSHEALSAAESGFDKIYSFIKEEINNKRETQNLDQDLINKFTEAMDNDLNSAQALALIFSTKDPQKIPTIIYLLEVLGFDLQNHENKQTNKTNSQSLEGVMQLVLELRKSARKNKDFETSDQIRDQLKAAGITIKDYRDQASTWELA